MSREGGEDRKGTGISSQLERNGDSKNGRKSHLPLEDLSLGLYLIGDTRAVVVVRSQSSLTASDGESRTKERSIFERRKKQRRVVTHACI